MDYYIALFRSDSSDDEYIILTEEEPTKEWRIDSTRAGYSCVGVLKIEPVYYGSLKMDVLPLNYELQKIIY